MEISRLINCPVLSQRSRVRNLEFRRALITNPSVDEKLEEQMDAQHASAQKRYKEV
jgi:hypothetical protein